MLLINGGKIHSRLEENPHWKIIPVVFLTVRTNKTAEDMYKRYDINYIKKTFNIFIFKEIIEKILFDKQ
jgi:hypothetical protein